MGAAAGFTLATKMYDVHAVVMDGIVHSSSIIDGAC